MLRLEQPLEVNHEQPLYVRELCNATGAPDRSSRQRFWLTISLAHESVM